jgi:hypothetical protein
VDALRFLLLPLQLVLLHLFPKLQEHRFHLRRVPWKYQKEESDLDKHGVKHL